MRNSAEIENEVSAPSAPALRASGRDASTDGAGQGHAREDEPDAVVASRPLSASPATAAPVTPPSA